MTTLKGKPQTTVATLNEEITNQVLKDVLEHRIVQFTIWGEQKNSLEMWHMIASEEMGEISSAIQDFYMDETQKYDYSHIYEETVQTIAVLTTLAEQMRKVQPNLEMPEYDIEGKLKQLEEKRKGKGN